MAARKDLFGCPGELARRIKVRIYAFSSLFYLRPCYGHQNANTTLSLQLPMKFRNIIQVETSQYLTIRLRYNYYVQLVAARRGWMRVPNLKFQSAR